MCSTDSRSRLCVLGPVSSSHIVLLDSQLHLLRSVHLLGTVKFFLPRQLTRAIVGLVQARTQVLCFPGRCPVGNCPRPHSHFPELSMSAFPKHFLLLSLLESQGLVISISTLHAKKSRAGDIRRKVVIQYGNLSQARETFCVSLPPASRSERVG